MNRNIAKQFSATLSLLDVASDKTNKYKCFRGEDVQLTVTVIGENGKPIDLSNTSVKIYFTLDKNVNEPVYRQDTGIVVDNLGIITVMLEKSYIRIGNNTLKMVLYDEDQTVFLQPLIISCIDPLIGEVADLEIPDDINVRDELGDIRRITDDLGREIIEAKERLDGFDSQLKTNYVDINSFELANDWTLYDTTRTQVIKNKDGIKANICIEHPSREGSYLKNEYLLTIPNLTNSNAYKQYIRSGVMSANNEYKTFYYLIENISKAIKIKPLGDHLETDIRWLFFDFII